MIVRTVASRKYRRLIGLLLAVLFGLISSLAIPARSSDVRSDKESPALELARQGQQRYSAGRFAEAAELWQQAADAYRRAGDREGSTKSLVNQSQALQDLGLYPKACKTLLQAFTVENPDCSQAQLDGLLKTLSEKPVALSPTQAIGLRSLGDVLRRRGMLRQSQAFLQIGLSANESSPESGTMLLSLGNTERALAHQIRDRWDYEEVTEIVDGQSVSAALEPYQPALNAYHQAITTAAASPLTKIQARLNCLSLLLDIQQWWLEEANRRIASGRRQQQSQQVRRAETFVSQLDAKLTQEVNAILPLVEAELTQLSPSHAAAYVRINLAQSLMRLQRAKGVASLLETALQEARSLGDKRAETYALGYLGQYYSQEGRLVEATELTRQALSLSQEQNLVGDAREVVYLWQSQLGRLLKEQGDRRNAIAAYSAAFNTLQSLRTDLNANERDVRFDFRQEVKPVYLDLADLLLASDLSENELDSLVLFSSNPNREESEASRLELARQVIEALQLAELDNFFQDPCLEESDVVVQIDDLDPQAAVIYPIVLPQRLDVIISLPGKPLQQATIPVSDREVNETLDELYDILYNESVDNSAINIFRTIPLNPEEIGENLQKLLPIFTRVYDWIVRPFEAEFEANNIETLIFALNDRLQRVPMAALYDGRQYLLEKYGIALVPSLQSIDPGQGKQEKLKVLAAGVSEQINLGGEIFPALVNVPKELAQIEQAFPASQALLNEKFTATAFQNLLAEDFPIVHLATHGLFSSNPEKTFIIAGDRKAIGIEQLRDLLSDRGTRTPELLVLSACETATGDERAVWGLAGVAVRSGARSTLATLWPVGDASTAQLMGQFYQALKEPGAKKLAALRNAQLSLIKSLRVNPPFEEFKQLPPHPYYWAPYVLVGNWQ
ncbi:MAG: CHAT domain-containing protein [Hydrococcus sp. C42_A2020_068]|nr:CHAT domain-containing protein [Hydrococcus sp. C42_A2020_068]